MSHEVQRLVNRIARIEGSLASLRSASLAYSSIEDASIGVYEKGSIRTRVGRQHDGTWGAMPLDGPVPPVPTSPVTEGGPGTLTVSWDGSWFSEDDRAPLDLHGIEVYVAGDPFAGLGEATLMGFIADEAGGTVTVTWPQGTWFVGLAAKATTGRRSDISEMIEVEVESVVDQAIIAELNQRLADARDALDEARRELEEGAAVLAERLEDAERRLGENAEGLEQLGVTLEEMEGQLRDAEDALALVKDETLPALQDDLAGLDGRLDDVVDVRLPGLTGRLGTLETETIPALEGIVGPLPEAVAAAAQAASNAQDTADTARQEATDKAEAARAAGVAAAEAEAEAARLAAIAAASDDAEDKANAAQAAAEAAAATEAARLATEAREAAEAKAATAQARADAAHDRAEALEGRTSILETDLAEAEDRIEDVENVRLPALSTALSGLDDNLSNLEGVVGPLPGAIDAAAQAAADAQSTANTARQEATDKAAAAEAAGVAAAEAEAEAARLAAIAAASSDADDKAAAAEAAAIAAAAVDASQKASAAQQAAEAKAATAQSRADAAHTRAEALEGRTSTLEADLAEAESALNTVRNTTLPALDSRVAGLDSTLGGVSSSLGDLDERLSGEVATKGRVYAQDTAPDPDPNGLWLDTAEGNTPHRVDPLWLVEDFDVPDIDATVFTYFRHRGNVALAPGAGPEGSAAIRFTSGGSGSAHRAILLPTVYSRASVRKVSAWVRVDSGTNIAGLALFSQAYRADVDDSTNNGYQIYLDARRGTGGSAALQIRRNATTTPLATRSLDDEAPAAGAWYKVEADISPARIVATVYDEDGNNLGSATTANVDYQEGWIGIQHHRESWVADFRINDDPAWQPVPDAGIEAAQQRADEAVTLIGDIRVDGNMLVDGSVGARHVLAEEVAGAVGSFLELNANQITSGQIDTARLNAQQVAAAVASVINLNASRITAGTINTARLNASQVAAAVGSFLELNAGQIVSGQISTERLDVEDIAGSVATFLELSAEQITSGTINTARLNASQVAAAVGSFLELNANQITAGTIATDRLDVSDLAAEMATVIELDAGVITSGTINTDRLNTNTIAARVANVINLNASRIIAGTINTARLNVSQIAAAVLTVDSVGAREINVQDLVADEATVNSLWANVVRAGLLQADEALIGGVIIEDGAITAEHIVAEDIAAAVGSFLELNANQITAGTINTDRLNVGQIAAGVANIVEIDASQITSGRITTDRLDLGGHLTWTGSDTTIRVGLVQQGQTGTLHTGLEWREAGEMFAQIIGRSESHMANRLTISGPGGLGGFELVGNEQVALYGAAGVSGAFVRVGGSGTTIAGPGGYTTRSSGLGLSANAVIFRGPEGEFGSHLELAHTDVTSRITRLVGTSGASELRMGREGLVQMWADQRIEVSLDRWNTPGMFVDASGVRIQAATEFGTNRVLVTNSLTRLTAPGGASLALNNNGSASMENTLGGMVSVSDGGGALLDSPRAQVAAHSGAGGFDVSLLGREFGRRVGIGWGFGGPAIYQRTGTVSSNVFINSNGWLERVTSASRFKIDPQVIARDRAERILDLDPKDWIDKASADLYADMMSGKTGPEELGSIRGWDSRVPGVIAEEVEAAGLSEFVEYDEEGVVQGLAYDRLWVLLIPLVREMRERINHLEGIVISE